MKLTFIYIYTVAALGYSLVLGMCVNTNDFAKQGKTATNFGKTVLILAK
jgi:hypothetical protein